MEPGMNAGCVKTPCNIPLLGDTHNRRCTHAQSTNGPQEKFAVLRHASSRRWEPKFFRS